MNVTWRVAFSGSSFESPRPVPEREPLKQEPRAVKSPPTFPAAAIAAWCGKQGCQGIKGVGERVNQ